MSLSTTTPIGFIMGGGAGAPSGSTAVKTNETLYATSDDINPVMEEFIRNLNNETFRQNHLSAQKMLIEKLKKPEFLPGLPVEIRANPFTILGSFQQSLVKWVDWNRAKGSSYGPGISDVFLTVLNDAGYAGKAILMGLNNFSDFHPKIHADNSSPIIEMLRRTNHFVQEQSLNPYFSIKRLLLPEDGTRALPIDVRHVGVVIPAKVGVVTEFDMEIRAYSSPLVAVLFHVNGTITVRYVPAGTNKKIHIQNSNGNFSHSGIKPKEDDTTYETEMDSKSGAAEPDEPKKSSGSSPFESCLFCLTIPVRDPDRVDRTRGILPLGGYFGTPTGKGMVAPSSTTSLVAGPESTAKRKAASLLRAVPGELIEGREVSPETCSDPEFPNSRIEREPGQAVQLTCFDLICASNFEQAASLPVIFHCLLQQFILAAHPNIASYVSPPVGTLLTRYTLPNDSAMITKKFGLHERVLSAGGASGGAAGAGSAGTAEVEESRDALIDAFYDAIQSNDLDILNTYNGDIHYINRDGNTGLMTSISLNLKNSFDWCIKQGVGRQIDRKHPETGVTALMLAAESENAYFVEKLIEAGANPFEKDRLHQSALDHAIICSRILPATYLLRLNYNLPDETRYDGISQVSEPFKTIPRPVALAYLELAESRAPKFEAITPDITPSKRFGWGSEARPLPKRKVIEVKTRQTVTIPLADAYTERLLATGELNPADSKHPYLINSDGNNLFMIAVQSLNEILIEKFLNLAPHFKEHCNEQNDFGETVLHSIVLAAGEDKSSLIPAQLSALKVVNVLKRLCPKLNAKIVDYRNKTAAALAEDNELSILALALNTEMSYTRPLRALRYESLPTASTAPRGDYSWGGLTGLPTVTPITGGASGCTTAAPIAGAPSIATKPQAVKGIKTLITAYRSNFKDLPIDFTMLSTLTFKSNLSNLAFVLKNRGHYLDISYCVLFRVTENNVKLSSLKIVENTSELITGDAYIFYASNSDFNKEHLRAEIEASLK